MLHLRVAAAARAALRPLAHRLVDVDADRPSARADGAGREQEIGAAAAAEIGDDLAGLQRSRAERIADAGEAGGHVGGQCHERIAVISETTARVVGAAVEREDARGFERDTGIYQMNRIPEACQVHLRRTSQGHAGPPGTPSVAECGCAPSLVGSAYTWVLEHGGRGSEISSPRGIVGLLLFWTLVVTGVVAAVIAAMAFVPIAGRRPRPARDPLARRDASDRRVTGAPLSITDQVVRQDAGKIVR